jgi:hypothetical protein
MTQYDAVCETQSNGHYRISETCGHAHRSLSSAEECAGRWERREERIARPYREAGLESDNGARYLARPILRRGGETWPPTGEKS